MPASRYRHATHTGTGAQGGERHPHRGRPPVAPPAVTLMLRSDRLTPAGLADKVLAAAGLPSGPVRP